VECVARMGGKRKDGLQRCGSTKMVLQRRPQGVHICTVQLESSASKGLPACPFTFTLKDFQVGLRIRVKQETTDLHRASGIMMPLELSAKGKLCSPS